MWPIDYILLCSYAMEIRELERDVDMVYAIFRFLFNQPNTTSAIFNCIASFS